MIINSFCEKSNNNNGAYIKRYTSGYSSTKPFMRSLLFNLKNKTMKSLREQYEDLDRAVNDRYRELINELKDVILYEPETEDLEENIYDCEIVTYISRRGENIDVKVLKISSVGGIFVAEDTDDRKRYWVGLNDLANLGDKIQIVTLLENEL